MEKLKRTTSDDLDFHDLITLLDQELKIRDGEEHTFYAQYNKIDKIKNVVIYFDQGIAIGCGSFKEFDNKTIEIKRMFVHQKFRCKGIGALILKELESWASEINYTDSVLETGIKQPEAINLYKKAGYVIIPNFGPYQNVANSICMKKHLNKML